MFSRPFPLLQLVIFKLPSSVVCINSTFNPGKEEHHQNMKDSKPAEDGRFFTAEYG
jgi:hypothetical protein